MEFDITFIEKLKSYGIGRRKLDDKLFADDKPPVRLGVFDVDEENLCHEIITATCTVPGCTFKSETLLEFENHYNSSHRYACSQCRKLMPSPHLLDLHIQENHDSFFAVMAERKPSYCCYIEECKEKFMNADDRLNHCVKVHKLPKDFRFEQKPQKPQRKKKHKPNDNTSMEVDSVKNPFTLHNSKKKGFQTYTGKKFTKNDSKHVSNTDVNMDDIVSELRTSLPK